MAAQQPMYLQSSSRRDPDHAATPEGHATIEVQTITPADPRLWGFDGFDVESGEYRNTRRYNEIKKIVLDGMLERMEQSYPGASSRVRLAELGSPATRSRFVGKPPWIRYVIRSADGVHPGLTGGGTKSTPAPVDLGEPVDPPGRRSSTRRKAATVIVAVLVPGGTIRAISTSGDRIRRDPGGWRRGVCSGLEVDHAMTGRQPGVVDLAHPAGDTDPQPFVPAPFLSVPGRRANACPNATSSPMVNVRSRIS